MKKFCANSALAILLISMVFSVIVTSLLYLYDQKEQAESKFVQDVFFSGCVKDSNDIEHRRACGRAAKAYANDKADYEAYGKTITWDEEARLYIIKGEK